MYECSECGAIEHVKMGWGFCPVCGTLNDSKRKPPEGVVTCGECMYQEAKLYYGEGIKTRCTRFPHYTLGTEDDQFCCWGRPRITGPEAKLIYQPPSKADVLKERKKTEEPTIAEIEKAVKEHPLPTGRRRG